MALRRLFRFRFAAAPSIHNHSNIRQLATTRSIMRNDSKAKEANPKESSRTATDDNAYKVQEYFSYNQNSFYDLECDLDKHRLEQPSPTKD